MDLLNSTRCLLAAAVTTCAFGYADAAETYLDVGKQDPITVLINSSPWYAGFEKVTQLYSEQTGNAVNLEVTPFDGMLQKARAAVRSGGTSPLDLININGLATVEFYSAGFVEPLKEIDPTFEPEQDVLGYDDTGCWNDAKQYRVCSGGKLMAISPNGPVQLFFYRKDVFDKLALKVPQTFDDLLANCKVIKEKMPQSYGFMLPSLKNDAITYAVEPFLLAYGASAVKDPGNEDYTVTINSKEGKQALDKYIEVLKQCGPPNIGSISQGDITTAMQTGKLIQAQGVVSIFSSFDDPQKSAQVGNINAVELPVAKVGQKPEASISNWELAIPKNASDSGKKGAIAFLKWFTTFKAQTAYAEGGAIPIRRDVFTSALKDKPEYRWMTAYLNTLSQGKQRLGYLEGAAATDILGIYFNKALIGELSSAAALNQAATEIHERFKKNGRKTGMLPPLQE